MNAVLICGFGQLQAEVVIVVGRLIRSDMDAGRRDTRKRRDASTTLWPLSGRRRRHIPVVPPETALIALLYSPCPRPTLSTRR